MVHISENGESVKPVPADTIWCHQVTLLEVARIYPGKARQVQKLDRSGLFPDNAGFQVDRPGLQLDKTGHVVDRLSHPTSADDLNEKAAGQGILPRPSIKSEGMLILFRTFRVLILFGIISCSNSKPYHYTSHNSDQNAGKNVLYHRFSASFCASFFSRRSLWWMSNASKPGKTMIMTKNVTIKNSIENLSFYE